MTTRQTREPFAALAADRICGQHKIVAAYDGSSVFPLYLYPDSVQKKGQADLGVQITPWVGGKEGRKPNFDPALIAAIEKRLGFPFVSDGKGDLEKTFGPEDVFDYVYAVFHSPTYRIRYAEFLKSDFPRVPLTSDVKLFRSLCGLGAELIALHLLESPALQDPISHYPVNGPDLVEKGFPKYVGPGEPEPGAGKPLVEGRVYINRGTGVPPVNPHGQDAHATAQYFEGVPPEVWQFHIGGYQVCEKWLKDRRGRMLTYDDQMHYCKVVTAIKETIRLMAEIDEAVPKWPIE